MTEDQIEVAVERRFDRLDGMLMRGEITQAQYDREAKDISRWARKQYKNVSRD